MKKITILKHSRGELANQLWNYISIYAYGLESGAETKNPSFFEYHNSFNFIRNESLITKFFAFWFRNSNRRRGSMRNRIFRKIYTTYSSIKKYLNKDKIVSSENKENKVVYLSPTSSFHPLSDKIESYFIGWLFRNPEGLKKWRSTLLRDFSPNKKILEKVNKIIDTIGNKYEKIIGIHVRQADYRDFKGGIYFIDTKRVREIINEYIERTNTNKSQTLFLFTSDGKIDVERFSDLNIYISKENSIADLFLLSKTDTIIGSDSSFGAFASWYGDIPHIVMTNQPIDWEYYVDKNKYFENKYSKMVQY